MRKKWTSFISLVLFVTLILVPLSATAEASSVRYTYQLTSSGWQLASAQANPKHGYYRVQSGDTLAQISIRFNITEDQLKQLNRLVDIKILPGQLILAPFKLKAKAASQPIQKPVLKLVLQQVAQKLIFQQIGRAHV